MLPAATQLDQILREYTPLLQSISGPDYDAIPAPGKWSKKQILGHLVDSALNNSRRFIVAQYQDTPEIVYNQDRWVELSAYQQAPADQVLATWLAINRHILHILQHMPDAAAARTCLMGGDTPRTLEFCADDYCRHLLHHLRQLIDPRP